MGSIYTNMSRKEFNNQSKAINGRIQSTKELVSAEPKLF